MDYELIMSQTFQNQLRRVPPKQLGPVLEKVDFLRASPEVDSKIKKSLVNYKNVFRIRCGDYRILYTFGTGWVHLLGIGLRRDAYHKGKLVDSAALDFNIEEVPTFAEAIAPEDIPITVSEGSSDGSEAPSTIDMLPVRDAFRDPSALGRSISEDLLERIKVDMQYWDVLKRCRTDSDLIEAKVPTEIRDRVFDVITAPDYDLVLEQPRMKVEVTKDLERFVSGDLVDFHLALDDRQTRILGNISRGGGPYRIKGAAGSGKSTLLLHAAKATSDRHLEVKGRRPSILFTTFTTTLAASAERLLQTLFQTERLSDVNVVVRTVDFLIKGDLCRVDEAFKKDALEGEAIVKLMRKVACDVLDAPSARQRESISLTRGTSTGWAYLVDEVESVIVGRGIETLEEYLAYERKGQKSPLGANQRQAVWRIHEAFSAALFKEGKQTFPRRRKIAIDMIERGSIRTGQYDAVLVDEAQDMDVNGLRYLLRLCNSRDTFYIALDPNQTIYHSGSDLYDAIGSGEKKYVHTYTMDRNYRSTREVFVAASSYLEGAELDFENREISHLRSGPLPIAQFMNSDTDELDRIVTFLQESTRTLRRGFEMCAVLVATKEDGPLMERQLKDRGIPAKYAPGDQFRLDSSGVHVLARIIHE